MQKQNNKNKSRAVARPSKPLLKDLTMNYFDAELTNQSVSTTVSGGTTILGQLMQDSDGVLASSPATWRISLTANDRQYNSLIRLHHMKLRNRVVGAQANSLLSGDLYNTVRFVLYDTSVRYLSSNSSIISDVDGFPDTADVNKVLYDVQYSLPSQAFDSATGYNVPQVLSDEKTFQLNRKLVCWTNANAGTSGWNTREGDILFDVVSDSSAAPHPTISIYFRIYYSCS